MSYYTEKLLKSLFSKYDSDMTLCIIGESLNCETEKDFRRLVMMAQKIIPFDFMTSGIGLIGAKGLSDNFGVLNVSYPKEWMDLYIEKEFIKFDPLVFYNFTQFKLQIWNNTYKLFTPPKKLFHTAADFGIKNGYTHGIRNQKTTEGSLFSFAGDYIEYSEREQLALEILVPHLHLALNRILKIAPPKEYTKLTRRETEVLKWVACGKTDWDISLILGVGLNCVKEHMKHVRRKLDVVSRPQAVAVAFEQKLINIP